jgi:maltose phosphorylase
MKDFILADEWKIIEGSYNISNNEIAESLCSIGNGHMGQRANFEENYSGKTLQGSYVGGVYYPDKTKVGWWKNGYPEYFAKVLNAVNWIGLHITINGELLDLHTAKEIKQFKRELDMMNGILKRSFICVLANGNEIKVNAKRFVSMAQEELGVLSYSIEALNFEGNLHIVSYLDADVSNKDSNYDEKFWLPISENAGNLDMSVMAKTKKTDFIVSALAHARIEQKGKFISEASSTETKTKYAAQHFNISISKGEQITIEKYVVIASSLNHKEEALLQESKSLLNSSVFKGISMLENEHCAKWHKIWMDCDIIIEGDVAAQQGIRFNIFQLYATYNGKDARLNIGPKGFTGEKYGGSTYWDTEAYCLPFYMATTDPSIARNLLVYRHNQLGKAIENAEKLGFKNGAALYPMVTMNGEECHNEWEITFEEIHRNGAIAYAIYDYINYTGDHAYMAEKGLDVLIGISRFWAQRVNFSAEKNKYVMLGVTGPNEYENNVNNNWYTNYIAVWCMDFTKFAIEALVAANPSRWAEIQHALKFDFKEELTNWTSIIENMYFPYDPARQVFLQQDGFLDKALIPVSDLPASDRPLNQKWSWDRILRSCYIKQADVLQGLYFFEDDFDIETHKRNFDFYEPLTVHESSLSPCVHSILAAKIGNKEKAYEMYLRTSRLDLNDYNNDTEDGLHITSMAGTWLSVVKGFGGLRVKNNALHFTPFLPEQFDSISFKIKYRNALIACTFNKETVSILNESDSDMTIYIYNEANVIGAREIGTVTYQS